MACENPFFRPDNCELYLITLSYDKYSIALYFKLKGPIFG